MKHILLLAIFNFILVTNIFSQKMETTYYADKHMSKVENNPKKAKYLAETTSLADSTSVIKFYKIKKKSKILISEKSFKNGRHTGIWKFYDKNGNLDRTVDNSIELKYLAEKFSSPYYFTLDKSDIISLYDDMVPPSKKGSESIFHCLYSQLKYPAEARMNGIQGEVVINVKVSKEGELEILGIISSADPILEKPSWIALQQCKNWVPATINNETVDSYATIPVKFKLQ